MMAEFNNEKGWLARNIAGATRQYDTYYQLGVLKVINPDGKLHACESTSLLGVRISLCQS